MAKRPKRITVAQGLLTAEPLPKAHSLLKQKWSTAFQVQQRQKQLAQAQPGLSTSTPQTGAPEQAGEAAEPQDERIKAGQALHMCRG